MVLTFTRGINHPTAIHPSTHPVMCLELRVPFILKARELSLNCWYSFFYSSTAEPHSFLSIKSLFTAVVHNLVDGATRCGQNWWVGGGKNRGSVRGGVGVGNGRVHQ